MSSSPLFRLSPIAVAVLAFHVGPAAAQTAAAEPATTLPTVKVEDSASRIKADKVSSLKFTQPLVDTPQTITVIKKELMAQQGVLSLTDALRQTPGITFQQGENGATTSGDAVFLRGFDAQGSIFLDNIRDLSPAVRDLFNVEQVEVVKGPAGADNGRGVASGYINLVTKTPFADDLASGTLSYGSRDRRRLTADVNRKITDSIAARINVVGQDGGVAGRDVIQREQWGIAPSVAFGLGTDTRVTLFTQHLFQDNTPDGGVSAIGISGSRNPTLDPAGIVPKPVDISNFYGLDADFENIAVNLFSARFEHDFKGGWTVQNLSRYSRTTQQRELSAPLQTPNVSDDPDGATGPMPAVIRQDPATWTQNRSRQGSYRDNDLLTNQTNLRGKFKTGELEHSISAGFEFIDEAQYTPTYAVKVTHPVQVQTPANLYNPNPADPAVTLAKNGVYNDGDTTTAAVYLFDTVKITEQLQVNGGLRVEHYRTETALVRAATAAQDPGVTVGTLIPGRLQDQDTLVSYKVGGLFKPLPNGSVYVAYANSLRPPGGDNFTLNASATNISSPGLDPQKAENVEVGSKWDLLGGRLAATVALFRSVNKNDLARQTDDSVVQYGKRRVQGIELGVVGNITTAWQLSAGYTHQNTKVTNGVLIVGTDGSTSSTQTGSVINFSPKNSVTLWSSYALPLPLAIGKVLPGWLMGPLTVGGGLRYIDSQARTINNDPNNPTTGVTSGIATIEDYLVVDALASYAFTTNVGLQANVYNLLDERYVGSVNNSGQRYQPGTPRSYLLTLNVKY